MALSAGGLTGGQREMLWDDLRPAILELYIAKDRTLEVVMREMEKQHGFVATKSQYETRFKRWGFSKYVPAEVWPYITYHLDKRRREGKTKTEVVLSGMRMSPQRIEKARRRNCYRTTLELLNPTPRPKTPDNVDMLSIRTPPGGQLHVTGSLPWVEFMDRYGAVLDRFSRMTLSPMAGNTTAMGPSTSLGPALSRGNLPETRSWPSMCAFEKEFMPPGSVPSLSNRDRQLQVSRLYNDGDMALSPVSDLHGLFFALSNNLVNGGPASRQTIIDLFKASGLGKETLKSLYASGLFSVKAALDRLFEYAVLTLDFEVLQKLLETGASPFRELEMIIDGFNADHLFRKTLFKLSRYSHQYMTVFQLALALGHQDLISLLRRYGAAEHNSEEHEPNLPHRHLQFRPSTLSCAVLGCEKNPAMGSQILRCCLARAPKPSHDELYNCLGISVNIKDPVSAGILLDELFAMRDFGQSRLPLQVLRAALLAGDDAKAMRIVGLGLDDCPLAEAARAGRCELVELLLRRAGLDVNAGWPSPLQAAVLAGELAIAKMLISAGADVNHTQHRLPSIPPDDETKKTQGYDEAQQQWFGDRFEDNKFWHNIGFTPLGAAVKADDKEMIALLMACGAIPCQADLISAIEEGNSEFVDDYIDAGGCVSWPVSANSTPLAAALLAGHISLAEKMLQADTSHYDPSAICVGIFMSSSPGALGIVWALIGCRRGYYEHHRSEGLSKIIHHCWESIALGAAAMMGEYGLVRTLLNDGGIRPDLTASPLKYIYIGSHNCGVSLKKIGKRVAHMALSYMHRFHCHPAIQSDIVIINFPKWAKWHTHCSSWAVYSKDMSMVKLLWPEDKFAWASCFERALALHWRELIISLLAEGKRKGYSLNGFDEDPAYSLAEPLIIRAVEGSDLEIISLLLDAGADVNASGRFATVLSAAVKRGDDDLINLLLARGADVNGHSLLDSDSTTALRSACGSGRLRLVRQLIDRGAHVSERDCPPGCKTPFTPLCMAARSGRLDVLQVLLNAGALNAAGGEAEARVDCVRAVQHALHRCQNAAAELLKSFGGWGPDDEAILQGSTPIGVTTYVSKTFDEILADWEDGIEGDSGGARGSCGEAAPDSPSDMAQSASLNPDTYASDEIQLEPGTVGAAAVVEPEEEANNEEGEGEGEAFGAVKKGETLMEWLTRTGFEKEAGVEQGRVEGDWSFLHGDLDAPGYSTAQDFEGRVEEDSSFPHVDPDASGDLTAQGFEAWSELRS